MNNDSSKINNTCYRAVFDMKCSAIKTRTVTLVSNKKPKKEKNPEMQLKLGSQARCFDLCFSFRFHLFGRECYRAVFDIECRAVKTKVVTLFSDKKPKKKTKEKSRDLIKT